MEGWREHPRHAHKMNQNFWYWDIEKVDSISYLGLLDQPLMYFKFSDKITDEETPTSIFLIGVKKRKRETESSFWTRFIKSSLSVIMQNDNKGLCREEQNTFSKNDYFYWGLNHRPHVFYSNTFITWKVLMERYLTWLLLVHQLTFGLDFPKINRAWPYMDLKSLRMTSNATLAQWGRYRVEHWTLVQSPAFIANNANFV